MLEPPIADAIVSWRPQALQPEALVGIGEADATMFLLSFKGQHTLLQKAYKHGLCHEQVPVLVARDRSGLTAYRVLKATDTMTPLTYDPANQSTLIIPDSSDH